MKLVFSLLALVFASNIAHAELIPHVLINGREELTVEPGKVVEMRLSFTESTTGQKVTKFKKLNNKFMHLVIMKDDLSTMVHLHPTLIGQTGDFWTVLNQTHDDPDTQGADSAMKTPGKYLVFAEVFPDRGARLPASQYVRFTLESPGTVENKAPELNTANTKCEYVTYVRSDGKPGAFGDTYRVSLHQEVIEGEGGNLVKFHMQVKTWHRRDQVYFPERGLQEFMRMHGHMFIVSTGGQSLQDKLFVHSHGMIHAGLHDDHMLFTYFDRGELAKAPALRVWTQFKHNNTVQTAAFTFKYDAHLAHQCHH